MPFRKMTTFLLIHGGWHGGWAYRPLAQSLSGHGHEVYRPTLAGLAERAWEARLGINLQTHVEEIRALMDWENLDDVVLVAHSYGGFVATAVADAMPERFRALLYLDAFVPENGDTPFDLVPRSDALVIGAAAEDGLTMALPPGDALGLEMDHQRRVAHYPIGHPLGTMMQRVKLSGRYAQIARKAYILAEGEEGEKRVTLFRRFYEAASRHPGWDVHSLPGGHNLMLHDPAGVAAILMRYADNKDEGNSHDI